MAGALKPVGSRPRPVPPRPPSPGRGTAPDAIAQARSTLDVELARSLPPVPADKAAKESWIQDAKVRVAGLNKSLETLRQAWFDGKLAFDGYTSYSRKVWDFESRVRAVEDSLKPKPAPGPGPDKCPDYLTPGLVNAMNKNPDSPLNIFGALALPFTLLLDGVNGLSRLGGACPAKPSDKPSDKPAEKPADKPVDRQAPRPAPTRPKTPEQWGPGDFPTPPKDGPRYAVRPAGAAAKS